MRRSLFASFAVLLAAAAPVGESEFRDYHSMLRQLRSYGVDPTLVNWAEVEPLCVGFMNYKDDQTLYNRCRFDKALLQASWSADRETCDIEALAVAPESLRKQPRVVIGTLTENDEDSITTIATPRISRNELRIRRAATYNSCMDAKGWRNGRDWRLGQAN